jgi:hypothetical protein
VKGAFTGASSRADGTAGAAAARAPAHQAIRNQARASRGAAACMAASPRTAGRPRSRPPETRATCCATTRSSSRPTPDNSERKRRIAHSPARPAARGRKSRMSTQPGIAFVTGEGTLFRRFGSRAGLMIVLLDEDERAKHYPPRTAQRHRPRSAVPAQTRRSRCTAPTLGQLRSDRAAWAASVRRLRCCGS